MAVLLGIGYRPTGVNESQVYLSNLLRAMPRTKRVPKPLPTLEEIQAARKAGLSGRDIAARFGISRASVYNILYRAKRAVPVPREGEASIDMSTQSGADSDPGTQGNPITGSGITPSMPSTDPPETRIALLEKSTADLSRTLNLIEEKLTQVLDRVKAPPVVELDHGKVHASCPNCRTETTVPIQPETPQPPKRDFESELRARLTAPHENGTNAVTCANCHPKLDKVLQEYGYAPAPNKR
jgi:hypothetical protein